MSVRPSWAAPRAGGAYLIAVLLLACAAVGPATGCGAILWREAVREDWAEPQVRLKWPPTTSANRVAAALLVEFVPRCAWVQHRGSEGDPSRERRYTVPPENCGEAWLANGADVSLVTASGRTLNLGSADSGGTIRLSLEGSQLGPIDAGTRIVVVPPREYENHRQALPYEVPLPEELLAAVNEARQSGVSAVTEPAPAPTVVTADVATHSYGADDLNNERPAQASAEVEPVARGGIDLDAARNGAESPHGERAREQQDDYDVRADPEPLPAPAGSTRIAKLAKKDWRFAILAKYQENNSKSGSRMKSDYPNGSDSEIEIAQALCISMGAARGQSPGGLYGVDFNCVSASTWDSEFRRHIRATLGDYGAASAFEWIPRKQWEQCMEAMIKAPSAQSRDGQAFEARCVPILRRYHRKHNK
jgi:hypothetical protein